VWEVIWPKGKCNTNKSDVEWWKCRYKGNIRSECCFKKKKGWQGKKESDNKGKDSSNFTTEGEEFAHTTMFAGATLACNGSP